MKKLIITFSIIFIICLCARLVFEYYVEAVPVFEKLLTPLTWLTVAYGALALLFGVLLIIKEFRKK